MLASYNPSVRRLWFGLFPFRSPLLRVSRELRSIHTNIRVNGTQLILFSFPPGTEMFHFPGFASRRRYSADFQFKTERVSPFGYLRIIAWLAAPRSFSQLPASFIASWCLGIHGVPLVAWSPRLLDVKIDENSRSRSRPRLIGPDRHYLRENYVLLQRKSKCLLTCMRLSKNGWPLRDAALGCRTKMLD